MSPFWPIFSQHGLFSLTDLAYCCAELLLVARCWVPEPLGASFVRNTIPSALCGYKLIVPYQSTILQALVPSVRMVLRNYGVTSWDFCEATFLNGEKAAFVRSAIDDAQTVRHLETANRKRQTVEVTTTGLEPATVGSEVRRAIHCATRPVINR